MTQLKDLHMGVQHQRKMVGDGDNVKPALEVSFTNGALDQLERLKTFFELKDETEAIQMGMSILQRIMNSELEKRVKEKENEKRSGSSQDG